MSGTFVLNQQHSLAIIFKNESELAKTHTNVECLKDLFSCDSFLPSLLIVFKLSPSKMNPPNKPAIRDPFHAAFDDLEDDFDSWPAPCTLPFGCSVITNAVGEPELLEHASNNVFGSIGVAEVATHRTKNGGVHHHPGRSSKFVSLCMVGFTHVGEPGFVLRDGSSNSPTQQLAAFAQAQLGAVSVWQPFPRSAELRLELEFVLGNHPCGVQDTTEPWLNQHTIFAVQALEGVLFVSREQIAELHAFKRHPVKTNEQPCTKILLKPLSSELNSTNPHFRR